MEHAEILHRCFRCGYCKLPGNYVDLNCPAYLRFRFETFAPGGRMWLLRALLEEDIEPSARMQAILFSCATCGNCTTHCAFPEFRERILDAFTAGKEMLVDAGRVPGPVRDYLTALQAHGNPYKLSAKKRAAWAEGSDLALYDGQEYLFYVGDVGSCDDRGRAMALSVARMLKQIGISFGILGREELSDGNDARAMGETALFEHLAAENIERFRARGVQKVITLSPHAFNAFKNHYPGRGGSFQTFHYTQVLGFFGRSLDWPSAAGSAVTVAYHDPCYLGRHNLEYEAARGFLAGIPGVDLVEMDRNRKNALCCGGGGGNFFTDMLGSDTDSPARVRVREAAATGAGVLAVACPQCSGMLDAAVKTEGLEADLVVKDLAEIAGDILAGSDPRQAASQQIIHK